MQLMGPRVAALGILMASAAVTAFGVAASLAARASAATGASAPDDAALAYGGRDMARAGTRAVPSLELL
jgi:hypothetical protein